MPDILTTIQVSTSDIGGGAERIASDLHLSLLAAGQDSHLAVGHNLSHSFPNTVTIPNDENRTAWAQGILGLLPPLPAPPKALSEQQVRQRRALKALAEPIRTLQRLQGREDFHYPGTKRIPSLIGQEPDVIHLHNLHGGYFDLRELPRLSSSFPVVLTAHDTWLSSGHCAYSLDCDRWIQAECHPCKYVASPPALPRDNARKNLAVKQDIFKRSSIHLVGPSQWVLDQLERSIFANAVTSVHHIPNGVDQSIFKPSSKERARQELGIDPSTFVITFSAASKENPYKDFATTEKAVKALLARDSHDKKILLLELGGKETSSSLGRTNFPLLAHGIHPVPYLKDPQQLALYLQASDLCVHMAHAENHPLAILEAQSCGVPVIASRTGGIPETVVDNQTGLLVPAGDSHALAEALFLVRDNSKFLEQMSLSAARHAQGRFSLSRMTSDYLRLYEDIAAKADRPV